MSSTHKAPCHDVEVSDEEDKSLRGEGNPLRKVKHPEEFEKRVEKEEIHLKEGLKFDDGKLRYDLIPPKALKEYARVLTIGARKYGERNWEAGIDYHRCIGALFRHFEAFRDGETQDPEGQHHLASVMFYCGALMEFEDTHPERDDRPKRK